MRWGNAIKLHKGDEVKVKRTRYVGQVIETIITPKENTYNNIQCCDIYLDNGEWYGYKEVK